MSASDYQAAGLYDPDAENAADRLALLDWLAGRGFTLDEMKAAHAAHRLTAMAGDGVIRPGELFSLEEVAERADVSVEEIERIRRAVGLPAVTTDEAVFSIADAEAFKGFQFATQVMGEGPVLEFTRVLGSSLARVAESAVWLFLENVEAPLVGSQAGQLALAKANLEATELLVSVPRAMDPIFRFHIQEAIRRSRQARVGVSSYDSAHLAVGFIDLVGYTPVAQQLTARELTQLVAQFEGLAHDVITANDGRLVKLIGDEVMFVAVDPVAACQIAATLMARYLSDTEVTPRGGLAVGELLTRGGDYYGPVVNVASRIADLAVPNELLVTNELRDEVSRTSDAFQFDAAGRRMLKGFDEPVELFSLSRA